MIGNIRKEFEEGILTITMDRPEKKNALSLDMYRGLADALEEAEGNPKVRCIILSGAGGNFTSGNDLADFVDPVAFGKDSPALRFIRCLAAAEKPLVAAVEGLALGIGLTMLLYCDLVYAGRGSRFQAPFVKLGLCPEAGSSLLLPRLIGPKAATEMILLGEIISAERGDELGLVNAVLPDGEAQASAREAARRLVAQPAAAVRLSKRLLKRELETSLPETIKYEAAHFLERLASPEAAEALAAFKEKRKADFSSFS